MNTSPPRAAPRASVGAVRALAILLATLSFAVFGYGLVVLSRPRESGPYTSGGHGDPVESALLAAALVVGLSAIGLLMRSNVARLLLILLLSVAALLSACWFGLTLIVALSGWGPRSTLLSQLSPALVLYFGVFLVAGSGALFLASRGVRHLFDHERRSTA